jgi:hypothetical protein
MVRSIVLRISAALAVALTAGAVFVATGSSATATQDQAVTAGTFNTETAETTVQNSNSPVNECSQDTNSFDGFRGCGAIGIQGMGVNYGVYGYSPSGTGVYGISYGGDAIVADLPGSSTGTNGVSGSAENGHNGVNAQSNAGPLGVNGQYYAALFAQNNSTGTALWARNLQNGGNGAYIEAYGSSSTALKVLGGSGATALKVTGASTFSSKTSFARSGTLTVSAGTAQAIKTGISLSSSSLVLATIQGNQAGVYVQGVTVATGSSGSFTIHLNTSPSVNLMVAWFVIG